MVKEKNNKNNKKEKKDKIEKQVIKDFLNQKSYGGFTRRDLMIKAGNFLILILFIPLFFPSGRSLKYTDLAVNSIVTKEIIAPFSFSVLKSENQLAQERQAARDSVPFFFQYSAENANRLRGKFKNFLNYIDALPDTLALKISNEQVVAQGSNDAPDKVLNGYLKEIYENFDPGVSSNEILKLIKVSKSAKFKLDKALANRILHDLYTNIVIDKDKDEIISNKIVIIKNGVEEDVKFSRVLDIPEGKKFILQRLKNVEDAQLLSKLLFTYLKPNAFFDPQRTEQEQKITVEQVPIGSDIVYKDERIIDANERVTEEVKQKLHSLEIALAEKSNIEGNLRNIFFEIGKFLLTAFIIGMLFLFIIRNRPEIFADNKKLFLLILIIFLQVGLGALMISPLSWPIYVIPTTIASMLLAILFDVSIGLMGTLVIGLLLGGILGMDYSFTLMVIIVGLVAVYSVAQIRTRNQIFRAVGYILITYVLLMLTYNALRYESITETMQTIGFFIIPNAILAPIITYMSLGLFERAFDITTDVTLLELSDMNHPLLKKLATKAPGTFHHSIIVGNLAESAAKEIGANSLLARVGSYYHDIGKMQKSEYFVENQKGSENKHVGLAPNMSALILAAHVKNGLDLAAEYKLPRKIADFIPEHHGTNIMSYFYNKALEMKGESEINEDDYRYPGPKPRSKETAIVMLADMVEATSRTIKNPTPGKFRKMVREFVEKRFLDGELDECNLTIHDLKGITNGFVSVLIGIHHERIDYPNGEKKEAKKVMNKNG